MSRKGNNVQKNNNNNKVISRAMQKISRSKTFTTSYPCWAFWLCRPAALPSYFDNMGFSYFFLTLGWWSPQTMSGFAKIHPRIKFIFFLSFRQKILRKKCPAVKKYCAKNVLLRIVVLRNVMVRNVLLRNVVLRNVLLINFGQ